MASSVGIREFRAGLTDYIASGEPIEVTRRGQMVAVFIPISRPRRFDVEAFVAVAEELRTTLTRAGIDPADIIHEFGKLWHARA